MILLQIITIDYVKICSIFSMHFMVINNIKNEIKEKNAAQKLKFSHLNKNKFAVFCRFVHIYETWKISGLIHVHEHQKIRIYFL